MGFIKDMKIKQELELYMEDKDQRFYNQKKKIKLKSYLTILIIISVVFFNILEFGVSQLSITISIILLLAGIAYEISKYYYELRRETEIAIIKKDTTNVSKSNELQANENLEKQNITQVILKDDEGHNVKSWELENLSTLIIGKENAQNHVEIDLSNVMYSALISRKHGILNRSENGWYYEDLNSLNGSMIEKNENGEKLKISRGTSVKIESGDYLYISNTKLYII